MGNKKLDMIIENIAKQNHTTVAEVRNEMIAAMEEARQSSDPAVQARWANIPHKGNEPTIEEFVSYLARIAK